MLNLKNLSWKPGDWLQVNYGGVLYPGSVAQIIGNKTEVDCLQKSGKYWKWPEGWPQEEKRDKIWYDAENIVKTLSLPEPVSNRGQLCFKDF
jgi:hypothetical protein